MSFTHIRELQVFGDFYLGKRPIFMENDNPGHSLKRTLIDSVFCSDSESTIFILKWPVLVYTKFVIRYLCAFWGGMGQVTDQKATFLQPLVLAVLQLLTFGMDAAKMASVLNQIVKNEFTQDSGIAYTRPQADSIRNFSFLFKSTYTVLFRIKFSIEWYINWL